MMRQRKTARRRFQVESLEARNLLAVTITEFLTSNDSDFVDEDGETTDWIEIHNSGPDDVNLAGWHLTDDATSLTKWKFPSHLLESGSYLVVFASDKNRAEPGSEFHTNFKLTRSGEYLGLIEPNGRDVASDFGPSGYPEQQADVSYGWTTLVAGGESGNHFMPTPTPGDANTIGVRGILDRLSVSVERGFFSATDLHEAGALSNGVTISAAADAPESVEIYYTTDGSLPTTQNPSAILYTAPVEVQTTTTLRAAAFAAEYLASDVETHTYLFTSDVLQQDGAGFPALTQTDYEMDPDVVNDPRFDSLEDDLKSMPTLSFVGNVDDIFGPDGIIENPERFGREWEKEVSVEMINADGTDGFQVDAGLRIQGAGSRARSFSKKSFQLFFRGDYGSPKLEFPFFGEDRTDEIDRIAFRGNFFDSWTFNQRGTVGGPCCGYNQVLQLRDDFGRETHEDMGALAVADTWVHLYLNGQYWGMYDATERPDEEFAESYIGGDAENYDVLKQRPRGTANGSPPEVVQGDLDAWNELMLLVRGDIASDEVYQQVKDVIDVEQFADYILLNIFGGNFDWPHNNWYALRERTDSAKWTFVSWDVEHFLFDVSSDRTEFNTNNSPGIIYSRLRRNADFRLLFADRVHQHMFNDGALTVQSNLDRFNAIVDEISAGMNAESARWGDTHVNPPRNTIDTWLPEVEHKRDIYFPQRTEIVLGQLRNDDLYPNVEAPEVYVNGVARHGGELSTADQLSLIQPSAAFVDTALVDEGALVSAYIPQVDEFATPTWTARDFSPELDPLWSTAPIVGQTGIGFDLDGVYDPWINTNIGQMRDNSGSVLTRIEFSHDDAFDFDRLQLQLRYDDAFVAYLNGTEVARSNNIRTQLPPQAARSRNHRATEEFDAFDISRFESLLVDGTNVLAIQGINVSRGSSDFLLVPKLLGGAADVTVINEDIWFTTDGSDPRDPVSRLPSAGASRLTEPFTLSNDTIVKSRAFVDGAWSALNFASYEIASLNNDLDGDGVVGASDIDYLTSAIREGRDQPDINGDGNVDSDDLQVFVKDRLGTSFGDANVDSVFDSGDLVIVFGKGEYEDGQPGNSTWAEGDWDGDGDFGTADLVFAFQDGGYVSAASAHLTRAAVAEDLNLLEIASARDPISKRDHRSRSRSIQQRSISSPVDHQRPLEFVAYDVEAVFARTQSLTSNRLTQGSAEPLSSAEIRILNTEWKS